MNRFLLGVLLLAGPLCVASDDAWRWNLGVLPAVRNGYVFPGSSNEKVSNESLVAGKSFPGAGRSKAIRPWGLEADVSYRLHSLDGPFATFRAVPFGLQLPNGPEQVGVDWFASAGYEISANFRESYVGRFRVGLRVRRWEIEHGPLPDSGHAGIIISGAIEGARWFTMLEAGLAAFNFGNGSTLGLQRDSSTLRLQAGAKIPWESLAFRPALEFFHTHRNFYSTSLIPGESALFIDEVSLALVLTTEW